MLMTLIIQKCDIMAAVIKKDWDFPGGPVVKTLPSNSADMGLIPGQGTKIPHATWCSQRKTTSVKLKRKK